MSNALNWLSPRTAAPLVGIHPATVRKLAASGEIEALDVSSGKVTRYRMTRAAVEKFLDSRRICEKERAPRD